MAVFLSQFWLLGAFFQLQHPNVLSKHFNRSCLWFTSDRTPNLSKNPFRCVFSRLNIDFGGSHFWSPNLSCLKVVLNFWSSVTGFHPPGILALSQEKLFKVLKQTKCFPFPLQPFLLCMDFDTESVCWGWRWEDYWGAESTTEMSIFPSPPMVEGSSLLAAFLCAKEECVSACFYTLANTKKCPSWRAVAWLPPVPVLVLLRVRVAAALWDGIRARVAVALGKGR